MNNTWSLLGIVFAVGVVWAGVISCGANSRIVRETPTPYTSGASPASISTPKPTLTPTAPPPANQLNPPATLMPTDTPIAEPTPAPTSIASVSATAVSTPAETSPGFRWQNDGLTDRERSVLRVIQSLEREYPRIAQLVLRLPWLIDGVTRNEESVLVDITVLAGLDTSLSEHLVSLNWFSEGVTEDEKRTISDISTIARYDLRLAQSLVRSQWFIDGITEDEMALVSLVPKLSGQDVGLTQAAMELPWIADGINAEEGLFIREISTIDDYSRLLAALLTAEPKPFLSSDGTAVPAPVSGRTTFSWQEDGLTEPESRALKFIEKIEREYPSIAQVVLGYPWLTDGVNDDERFVLGHVPLIAGFDVPMVQRLVRYPWLADGITRDERQVITHISTVAKYDVAVAQRLIDLPWFADNISSQEEFAVSRVRQTIIKSVPLAEKLMSFQWFTDEITDDELKVVTAIGSMADQDITLAQRAADFPWIANGVSAGERSTLTCINTISRRNLPLGQRLVSFPWVADGVTEYEGTALHIVCVLGMDGISLGQFLVDLPWFADGIDKDEGEAFSHILPLAHVDVALAQRAAAIPWLVDGPLTEGEREALIRIQGIANMDAAIADSVMASDFFDGTNRSLLWDFRFSIDRFIREDSQRWEQVANRPWFQDGLTAEEAALIVVLNNVLRDDERLFQEFVDGVHVSSRTFPVGSGEVHVFLVGRPSVQDVGGMVFKAVSAAVQAMVDFMGPPWVKSDVILYIDTDSPGLSGRNLGSLITIHGDPGAPQFRKMLYHEAAHYYDGWLPLWLTEGWAEFMASYTLHVSENVSLESRYNLARQGVDNRCVANGITNVHEWMERGGADGFTLCHYSLGESFLLGMYNAVGEEIVRSSLRELYWNKAEVQKSKGPSGIEEDIYKVFLSNTPQEKREDFRTLYRHLHGGPAASR